MTRTSTLYKVAMAGLTASLVFGCNTGSRNSGSGSQGGSGSSGSGSTTPGSNTSVIFEENFDGQQAQVQVAQQTIWEMGAPTSGPMNASSGAACFATVLGGQYPDNADDPAILPSMTIPAGGATLSFVHYHDIESDFDGGHVLISTDQGQTFALLDPQGGYTHQQVVALGTPGFSGISGTGAGWTPVSFDLGAFANQDVIIAFRFASDGSITADGWYIDDITVTAGGSSTTPPGGGTTPPPPSGPTTLHSEDFETGAPSYSAFGGMEVGAPSVVGPAAASQGSNLAGTDLDSQYANNMVAELISDSIDLSQVTTASLFFKHHFEIEQDWDGAQVLVQTGSGQRTPITPTTGYPSAQIQALNGAPGFSGFQAQFVEVEFDLSAFAGQQIQIVWQFGSDGSITESGYYVDEVRVIGQ